MKSERPSGSSGSPWIGGAEHKEVGEGDGVFSPIPVLLSEYEPVWAVEYWIP